MRRALLLSLGMAGSSFAFFGDWKIWSPVQTARMAVYRSDKTIYAATTGGVVEWDPVHSKGTVHNGMQGLPSLDIASIVADSSGRIWAIGTDGHVAYLDPGATTWQPVGSYTSSGWTFNPGAATFWKGYLVLGGAKGLSLFATNPTPVQDQFKAVDNITAFGSIRDTVTSVMAQGDTLWVALPEGLAYATDPVWNTDSASKHIGKAGYYLSSDRWTVQKADSRGDYTLLRDSTGVHLGNSGQWSDFANGLKIDADNFTWKGGSAKVPGANQALATTWGYFMSTSGNGLQLLTTTGNLQALHPDGALPDNLPYFVAMEADGTLLHLTGDGSSMRLWRKPQNGAWSPDTIQLPASNDANAAKRPVWDLGSSLTYQQHIMTVGPSGEVVIGTWENPTSHGGFLVSSAPGNWALWNHTNDTCFPNTESAELGTVAMSVHATTNGVWGSTLTGTTGPIFFFPSSGDKTPTCLEIDGSQLQSPIKLFVSDMVSVGSALWLATSNGLVEIPNAAPANPAQVPSGLLNWQHNSIFNRLAQYPLSGQNWIIAAGNGFLETISSDANSQSSLYTADGATQNYMALAVDAQGQIWAAGEKGIEIYTLQLSDSATPAFQLVKKVTQFEGLPDNNIRDLVLDSASGKALIATEHGLSLWTSPYRSFPARLAKSAIKVWPNPVRLRQNSTLFVDGATAGAQFDLVAADGTLVLHQAPDKSVSGRFQINLPSTSKMRPGVYYWSLKDSKNSVHGPLLVGE